MLSILNNLARKIKTSNERRTFQKAEVFFKLTFTLSFVIQEVAYFALTVIRTRYIDTLSSMTHIWLVTLI